MMATEKINAMPTLAQLLPMVSLPDVLAMKAISGLTIDSREVEPGYLFVAVQGLQLHGKTFIPQAISNGAIAVLIDESETAEADIPVIKVANIHCHLSELAGKFYGQPSYNVPVIGVTGTNGKTTCTQLLAQCFAHLNLRCGVVGTLGYGVVDKESVSAEKKSSVLTETGMTTSDAISTQKICANLVKQNANIIAMEVSSHGLSQHRIEDIFIRTAVFTNLSHDHLDYHGSMEVYGKAKTKLFAMPSVIGAVVNIDDGFSHDIIQSLRPDVELITYGLNHQVAASIASNAHFTVKSIVSSGHGIKGVLVTPSGDYSFETALVGQFNISNLLAVVATLYVNHYELSDIVNVLPLLKPVAGRMEVVPNQAGIQVVIDYAHTPDALKNALSALSSQQVKGKLWCVFGCGGDRDRAKRPEMAAIVESLADEIILTSDNPRTESSVQIFADVEAGFSKPRDVIVDRANAIDFAISHAAEGDTVLIAGKGHENYQIIGTQRFAFSDVNEARLSLRRRELGEVE